MRLQLQTALVTAGTRVGTPTHLGNGSWVERRVAILVLPCVPFLAALNTELIESREARQRKVLGVQGRNQASKMDIPGPGDCQ